MTEKSKYYKGYSSEHYFDYKPRRNFLRREFIYRWKARVYELLGGKCCRCGFSDIRALQIDHINGRGSLDKHKNSTYYKKVAHSVEKGEKEFQILCANCNWIKRHENKEFPHSYKNNDNKIHIVSKEATLFPI